MTHTLPPPRPNVARYVLDWDKAAAALTAEPDTWLLLGQGVAAQTVTRLRAGLVTALAPLHPHVQYQLSQGVTGRQHLYRGLLWAYYTPGRPCRSEVERLAREAMRAEIDASAPTYPPIPRNED
jgi:hypothetical protein